MKGLTDKQIEMLMQLSDGDVIGGGGRTVTSLERRGFIFWRPALSCWELTPVGHAVVYDLKRAM